MELNSLDVREAVRGWPIFRDGHVRKFLVFWIEKQIAYQSKRLETIGEQDLKSIQGQIAGLRVVRGLLDSMNIETAIADLTR